MPHSTRQFLAFTSLYAFVGVLNKGLMMAVMLWLARSLPQQDYAVFGLLYAIMTGFAALAAAGVVENAIASRHRGETSSEQLQTRSHHAFLVQSLLIAPLLLVAALLTLQGIDGLALWEPLSALAGGCLTAYSLMQAGLARLDHDHLRSVRTSTLAPMAGSLLGCMAIALAGHSHGAFFLAYATGAALVLWQDLLSWFRQRSGGSWHRLNADLIHNTPHVIAAALVWLTGYGSLLLLNFVFDPQVMARYTLALTLSAALQIVVNSANQVWSPRHFDAMRTHAPADVERRCRRYYLALASLIGLAGVSIYVLLPLALRIGGGNFDAYAGIGREFLWLCAGYALSIPWWHAQNMFFSRGESTPFLRILSQSSLAGVAVWAGFMFALGEAGLYSGYCAMMLVRAIWFAAYARARWQSRLHWEGVALGCALLAAASLLNPWN